MWQRIFCLVLFFYSIELAAADTLLKLFRPYGESAEQDSQITKTLTGDCFSQSQLILREDAWRCSASGTIYDPCFVKAGPDRTEALCFYSPWVSQAIKISVNEVLDNEQNKPLDMSRTYPWAIVINGERCQAVASGATYEEMPVRYQCSQKNFLFGHLQRCRSSWTMLEKTSEGVVTMEVKKAWF